MGFPLRTTRTQFGPALENEYPVQNPKTQVGAETWNPLFWQVAGMNVVAPRACVLANWNTGSSLFDVAHQAEAWNPDGAQARPVLARVGAGNYTYTFAASYLDETGTARSTVLHHARVTDNKTLTAFADRLEPRAWIAAGSPLVVQVRLWDAGGTLVDAPFWLEVF